MTKKYVKGDWNSEHCEIWYDGEYFGDVRTKDSDKWLELLNMLHEENQKLLTLSNMKKGALVEAVKELTEENEQLKEIIVSQRNTIKRDNEWENKAIEEIKELKKFISKIDFAISRKYDNSLENLLDEIYDGEYDNWIKKQVSRARRLE